VSEVYDTSQDPKSCWLTKLLSQLTSSPGGGGGGAGNCGQQGRDGRSTTTLKRLTDGDVEGRLSCLLKKAEWL